MITKEEIIAPIKNEKSYLVEKYNISAIGLFGSYVRGEQRKKSDVDILVDFSKIPDIIKLMELEEYLSAIIGKKIDLVSKSALKPVIGSFINKEVLYV